MFLKTFKKSLIFVLLLPVAILMMTGCGGTSNPDANTPPTGDTWHSTSIVDYPIQLTIGAFLGSMEAPELEGVYHFYKGEISCSALKDGKKTIAAMPDDLMADDYIAIIKYNNTSYPDSIAVWAGKNDDSGGQVFIFGNVLDSQLCVAVQIMNHDGDVLYQTPGGSDGDIFIKN